MAGSPHGTRYWAVGLVGGTVVHTWADWVETPPGGVLRAWRDAREDDPQTRLLLTVAAGQWQYVHPADMADGTPPAVTRWPGIVDRGHPGAGPPGGGGPPNP